jgi:uncharacterized membrane protein
MHSLSEKEEKDIHFILNSGVLFLLIWSLTILATLLIEEANSAGLFAMVATHVVSGRAGGISVGLEMSLPSWLIVLNSTAVDTIIVLILYPIFVLSYNKTVKNGFIKSFIESSIHAADNNRTKVGKYGIIGLLLFVWFPLHMTGPLAGAILGFLIGIPTRKTIAIVVTGTFLAVLSWLFIFRQLFELTGRFSLIIPVVVVLFSGGLFLFYRFKKRARG